MSPTCFRLTRSAVPAATVAICSSSCYTQSGPYRSPLSKVHSLTRTITHDDTNWGIRADSAAIPALRSYARPATPEDNLESDWGAGSPSSPSWQGLSEWPHHRQVDASVTLVWTFAQSAIKGAHRLDTEPRADGIGHFGNTESVERPCADPQHAVYTDDGGSDRPGSCRCGLPRTCVGRPL